MQTLRKRTSPCKYKNDPSKFTGEGITFKAKLIGILEVSEARGDKMCQDALNDLKTAIRAAGEHKQRITISISTEGLRLRDEKSGDCLYHHPVHKISFIAQDMSDSRAFGYIFGSPDTGHRFFGIKTDKTASQVVIAMRDLFQVVFELKKKEIEMAKHQSEMVHHPKCPGPGYLDSILFSRDDSEAEKAGKGKYSQLLKSRCLAPKYGEATTSDFKGPASEAIADLLDLEHELNSIQQGINQMDKITPSDPFGPLSKVEPYIDPFDDSFPAKTEAPPEEKQASTLRSQSHSDEPADRDRHSFFGSTAASGKSHFFSQFSPGIGKSKAEDSKWFDQETESLFSETVNVSTAEPTSSPVALSAQGPDPDQAEGKKSPIKTDLFTELDPLGTGRVKPYVDKKDFFQELKNPPKKVLKEMITDSTANDVPPFYFPAQFKDDKPPSDTVHSSITLDSLQGFKEGPGCKYSRVDPFDDGDPFEKTDPFQDEGFPASVGFHPLFGPKSSLEGIFDDKMSWQFDKPKETKEEKPSKGSPTNTSLFSSNTLRVSLPPEKTDISAAVPLSISTITSKLKSSPNSPEDSKSVRRKCYQSLKQSTVEGSEDSPVHEEPFVSTKIGSRPESDRRSPFKDKYFSVQSPPSNRIEKQSAKMYSSVEILDATTPDPPPRTKTTLFSIKPPPLPPKKQSQPIFKPPARPPSVEDDAFHYDYLEKKEASCDGVQSKEELKCVKLKKQLFSGKDSPPAFELRKQNSDTYFPVLLPPPNRKTSADAIKVSTARKTEEKPKSTTGAPGSILNLKLNQLDNTGLENLAITLGIPSENIYSMTLQELTKMLAEKYLNSTETKTETVTETFEADFDANFGKSETKSDPPTSYDKYAVFKELIENESKVSEPLPNANNMESRKMEEADVEVDKKKASESSTQEEDKYAALRQLSMNAQKSDNFSDDEEIGVKADGCDVTVFQEETASSTINNMDLEVGLKESKTKWSLHSVDNKSENAEGSTEKSPLTPKPEFVKSSEEKTPKDTEFPSDSQLFPLVDQFSDGKKPTSPRDNWATFEKSEFERPTRKKSTDNFNENENSPFSSDGKEEVPFHWHQKTFRKRTRKDVPWKDDDESWDDYSPKESFCSDESSHEEGSPETAKENRYRQPWKTCGRTGKSDRTWNEQTGQWSRRNKWQEETEDEFEESWRKQRERTGSYDNERQISCWHNNYESYNKRYDWCNSRNEPWNENERHLLCWGNRRKRSESDNEYRKRCDSDTSDKECVWTFQKGYPDGHGRIGKQKPYHVSGHPLRACPDRCHESRTKHRKGVSQKRPSSASEPKRNYEKLSSSADYPFRGSEKTLPSQRDLDTEEYSRYGYSKHRTEMNFPLYYSSFDRKYNPHKMYSQRGKGPVTGKSDVFPSPSEKGEVIVEKNPEFGFFEVYSEKSHKSGKSETRFPFDVETENFEKPKKLGTEHSPQDFPRSPDRRLNQWASANGKPDGDAFGSGRNNNDNFAAFQEVAKKNGKAENPQATDDSKPQPKNKNHLSMLSRQESSATLRKSDSINIFSRDKDPFEGDDFFSSVS